MTPKVIAPQPDDVPRGSAGPASADEIVQDVAFAMQMRWTPDMVEAVKVTLYALRDMPVNQRMEAMGMVPVLSIPPIDCTTACMDGPCDCSGERRVRGWGEHG